MKGMIKRHATLVQKICIGLLLAWFAGMLVLFWMSGEQETKEALISGKRYIVHIESGEIEGAVTLSVSESDEETSALNIEKAAEPIVGDATSVTNVQASSTPIADVMDDMIDKKLGVALPKISESRQVPWQYYVKKYRRQDERPLVAIVITGLGHSKHITDMALALDDRFSLSFSPYARMVASWAAASRLTGHEMYIDLPFQTSTYPHSDPGPRSILISNSNTQNIKNLYWVMSRFQGYAGLVAPTTEIVTSNNDTYVPIMKEVARRGVMMLVGHPPTSLRSDEENSDRPRNLVSMNAHIWIDEELTEMAIQARLATLEQTAQRNGYAIGMAHAYPLTLDQLKYWRETMGSRGVMLAPLSFIANIRQGR